MASVDREAVYAALFARLQAKLGANISTYSRKALDFDEVPASQQPALLCLATTQTPDYPGKGTMPPRWTIRAMVVVYSRAQPDEGTPETRQLAFAKLVEDALTVVPGEAPLVGEVETTLGNLTIWCRIGGPIEVFQGAKDQGVVLIPIEMLAAV